MWRWKSWSNVETASWFRRSVLQWVSCLKSDFHFQPCVGLQNQISVQAWIKRVRSEDSSLIVEWSWLNSRISDLWKSFGGKQGTIVGFTLNQTKKGLGLGFFILFFLFPMNWKQRLFHSDNPSMQNFLQEITSLHPAAAGWNQHTWYFHAC